jgi:hypothetical protein
MLSAVERNLPRLDRYLDTGLRVQDVGRRDALITAAMLPFVEDDAADEAAFDEAALFSALRRAACVDGLATPIPAMPRSGSASLRNAISVTTCEVRKATSRFAFASSGGPAATAVAASVAAAVIVAPVWFVQAELPLRLSRADAICSAAIAATSPGAPEPLAPAELEAQADDLAQAYGQVWNSLPAATIEARVLWELDLGVPDIARILGTAPAAVDTALLQILTANRIFNVLVGRESASQLMDCGADRSPERSLRGML